MKRKINTVSALVLSVAMLAGCSSAPNGEGNTNKQQQPITLKFYTGDKDYEDRFKREIADKVKAKYPYISFEFQGGKDLKELVLAGQSPDLYYQGLSALDTNLVNLNMQFDLSDLIKKSGFDLNRIDPAYLDIIRTASQGYGGTYFGLPVTTFTPVLFYNKEVFDKFGVPYPKDGMTWDDAYELSRKLTKEVDGVQYKGMTMNFQYLLDNNQLAAPYLHPKEDKAAVNTPEWRSIFTTLGKFYQIPLNNPLDDRSRVKEVNDFTKERISAMHADVTAAIDSFPSDFVNWDMVTLPTMTEAKGLNAQLNPRFYYIMSSSKHKEDAFKVIEFVLSQEMQLAASKAGKSTVLNNEEVKKAYGQEFDKLKEKNIGALYFNKPVKPAAARDAKLTAIPASPIANKEFIQFIKGAKDINTSLRDFEEALNKAIQAEKAK
ncbi:ABC transporter substrate-binding protein [Paenibacillus sp. UNC451MF]|uniref:ABC transporter substrate-binding protein n=1 Tax=Paenibacillus sp. UNC451MF TaxID=1449063 RepID=UPI00048B168F|nr:extracellular solute-binding protein [Paenibacillus sp. UNC451MF]